MFARRSPQLLLALLGAAACGEKAIEIELRPANAPGSETINLDCVDGVGVTAYDPGFESPTNECVEFAPTTGRTLRDLKLSGQLSMPLPPGGLEEIYVKGSIGGDFPCFGATAFYGGAAYDGGDTLTIFLYPNLSCDRRIPSPTPFRVIDLLSLLDTGTCVPAGAGLTAASGTIHDDPAYGVAFFDPSTPSIALVDGRADIAGMYSRAEGSGCLAGGLFNGATALEYACMYPDLPGACTVAGEHELAYVSYTTLLAARDEAMFAQWNSAVLAVIWDPATDRAIPGATVTIKHGDAAVVYTDYAAGAFTRRASAITGASGTLTFYSDVPAEIEVSAPGYRTRSQLYLGGEGYSDDIGAASVITLIR